MSNASMDIFKNNTLASFRNQLAQPLQLEGKWQVALESVIFPTNIQNLDKFCNIKCALKLLNVKVG